MANKTEKNLQNEMEKKVKMTTQEDSDSKEDSKEGLHKQKSYKNDEGRSEVKKGKEQALEESLSAGRKHLFGIPIDEQIVKLSRGPRSNGECGKKRRTHRYGTEWLKLQKLPTVRERIIKKMKTESRAKNEEGKGNEDKEDNKVKAAKDKEEKEEPKECMEKLKPAL